MLVFHLLVLQFSYHAHAFRSFVIVCVGERERLRATVLNNPSSFDVAVTTYDMVNSAHFGDHLKHTIHWR